MGPAVGREILEKAKAIKMILMDVDGVLTDGSIPLVNEDQEMRSFFVQDGLGIRMAQRAGIITGLISARKSPAVSRRATELQIQEVHQGVEEKVAVWSMLLEKYRLRPEQVAMVGDDWTDLPLLRRAGLSVAVADAAREVRERADYITHHPGGRGAVREVVELILSAQGRYEEELDRYLK